MSRRCPKTRCRCDKRSPKFGHFVRNGSYRRVSDSKVILRWKCSECGVSFSQATNSAAFGQNKRRKNEPLRKLLCAGVSMRAAARILQIHRTTVARKMRFLALQARNSQRRFLLSLKANPIGEVQFDEMETFEHSKYKPLSIPIAVTKERKILDVQVATMPARGPLAKKGTEKYGRRPDHRAAAINKLLSNLKPFVTPQARFESDENPKYPPILKKHFPKAMHIPTKGRQSAVTGQGELKKIKWDPLFALNHTAAMLRYRISRLIRKSWCVSKEKAYLADHLAIYIDFHNQTLTK